MQLDNTTVLPADDPDQAEQLFKSLMSKSNVVYLIIFGNTSVSEQAIQSANVRAGVAPAGFTRHAVWMQDSSQWSTLKQYVKSGAISVDSVDPSKIIALGTSLKNKAQSSIPTSKTPDFITMELAFVQASN